MLHTSSCTECPENLGNVPIYPEARWKAGRGNVCFQVQYNLHFCVCFSVGKNLWARVACNPIVVPNNTFQGCFVCVFMYMFRFCRMEVKTYLLTYLLTSYVNTADPFSLRCTNTNTSLCVSACRCVFPGLESSSMMCVLYFIWDLRVHVFGLTLKDMCKPKVQTSFGSAKQQQNGNKEMGTLLIYSIMLRRYFPFVNKCLEIKMETCEHKCNSTRTKHGSFSLTRWSVSQFSPFSLCSLSITVYTNQFIWKTLLM